MQFISNMKLRVKIQILLTIFGMMSLLTILPLMDEINSQFKESKKTGELMVARNLAEIVDRNLFERYGDVQAFTYNSAVQDKANWYNNHTESNQLIKAMDKYIVNYAFYQLMMVMDLDGNVAAINSKDRNKKDLDVSKLYNKNFADQDWFKKAVAGKFLEGKNGFTGSVVGQPYFEQANAELYNNDGFVIPFSAPVKDKEGNIIGVWVNFMDFSYIEEMVAEAASYMKIEDDYKNTSVLILNDKGDLIVDYNHNIVTNFDSSGKYVRDSKVINKLNLVDLKVPAAIKVVQGESGMIEAENVRIDGLIELNVYHNSKGIYDFSGLGWSVIARIPVKELYANIDSLNNKLKILVPGLFILTIIIGYFVGGRFSSPIVNTSRMLSSLAAGKTKFEVPKVKSTDEVGKMIESLHGLKESVSKALRLQRLVENLEIPILICDREFIIRYMNNLSLVKLKELEKHLPIKASEIIGQSIDIFHKNPAHQRKMIMNASMLPHSAKIKIGPEWMDLHAHQLVDENGDFDGGYINWSIVTDQVKSAEAEKLAQENINDLVNSALKGELDKRIDVSNFEGFYRILGESINNLMDTVASPIKNAINTLAYLEKGDLTKQIDGSYHGSFGEMKDSLNATISKMQDIVGNIRNNADSVNNAAREISVGGVDLSNRTEQQASALEEASASMEELTQAVKQNSENTAQANKYAVDSSNMAEKGGVVAIKAVEAMSNIEQSSQKISDIIGVIDEIAFQTNLLALNAAVEAARAGEAGKGFAVVAQEVRALAGRSGAASKEIKQLINDSAKEVKTGSDLVNQAGNALKDIVTSIKKVAELVSQIDVASKEQADSIMGMNSTISQMDEMTQQNAALVEQNTAAATSLSERSHELAEIVGFFNIGGEVHKAKEPVKKVSVKSKQLENTQAAVSSDSFDNDWKEF